MREHLCSEINIAVPGRLDGRHPPMHPLHARVEFGPAAIVPRNLTLERVNAVLKGLCSDRTARKHQNCYSQCDPHSNLATTSLLRHRLRATGAPPFDRALPNRCVVHRSAPPAAACGTLALPSIGEAKG